MNRVRFLAALAILILVSLFFWNRPEAPAPAVSENAESANAPTQAATPDTAPASPSGPGANSGAAPTAGGNAGEPTDYSQLSDAELTKKFDGIVEGEPNGNLEDLREIARHYARLHPNDAKSYKMIAIAELSSETMNSNEALAAIERGLSLSPNDAQLREQWFTVKALDENFDFQKYAAENPEDYEAAYAAAVDKYNKGDTEGASLDFNHISENAPPGPAKEKSDTALMGEGPPLAANPKMGADSEAYQN